MEKECSWIYKLKTIDFHDGLKYYIGIEYDPSFPEPNWFDILLKVYKDNSEPPFLMKDVRLYPDYIERRISSDEERKLFLEELHKRGLKIECVEDCGFISYKMRKIK